MKFWWCYWLSVSSTLIGTVFGLSPSWNLSYVLKRMATCLRIVPCFTSWNGTSITAAGTLGRWLVCVKNGDKKLRSTFAGSTFPSTGSSFNGIARHHRGLLIITLNGEDAAVLEFLQSKSHNQSLKSKIKVLQSKSRNHLSSLPSFLLDLWHSWHAGRRVWLRLLEVLGKKRTKAHSLKDSLAFTAISSRLQLQAEQSLANWLKITASAQKKISSRFFPDSRYLVLCTNIAKGTTDPRVEFILPK